MSKIHGKDSYIALDDTGDTETDVSDHGDSIEFSRTRDTGETTGFGATGGFRTFVAGLRDGTLSFEGQWDGDASEIDELLDALFNDDTARGYVFGPNGNGSGNVKYSGSCFLTDYTISDPVDGVVEVSAEFQNTGQPTRGSFS